MFEEIEKKTEIIKKIFISITEKNVFHEMPFYPIELLYSRF